MRKFNVNVNGTSYEVLVEEISGAAAPAAAPAPAPAAAPAPVAAAPAGGTVIKAPMPGNILSVNVAVGASVNKGDVLVVLEAMKMENEIMAPNAGRVTAVNAAQGATVNSGDVLVVLE